MRGRIVDLALKTQDQARDDLVADFEARFERLRSRLTAVCTAVAGADDALDLVHETYLRASERLHQLRDPALFDAWVVRIALNEAKSVLRSRQRRVASRAVEIAPREADVSDVGLRQLIEQLGPRERAVIVLHYAYGYRMREIARLLDLSEINVRTLAFRARRRLRAQMEEATE
jgi:RNA polymerase sigma-70 factor (ECF subfamily)